jgi:hypothetical protein
MAASQEGLGFMEFVTFSSFLSQPVPLSYVLKSLWLFA